MKTNIVKLMGTGAILLSVSACSTTSGSKVSKPVTITPAENVTRVYSNTTGVAGGPTQDAGGALQNGETLTARSVSVQGQNLNYGNGQTGPASAEVSVSRNAAGELTLVLNGVEQVFTAADRSIEIDGTVYGYDIADVANGKYVSAYNYTGTLDELFAPGNGYLQVLGIQSNQVNSGGDPNLKAFAVIGAETRDDVLAGLPTATYSGRTRMDVVPTTEFVNNSLDRTRLRSDLTMTANFGAGEISGEMTNFTVQPAGEMEVSAAGTIAMQAAAFDVNGYSGNLVADSAFTNEFEVTIESGTYSGAFYGPEAEQVGGVLSLSGTGDSAFNGIGFFEGSRD